MIDRVRAITNIFSGRTGTRIALEAAARGHRVVLLTSRPEVVTELGGSPVATDGWKVRHYRTFEELEQSMEVELHQEVDVLVHSAAVSDYRAAGIFAPAADTRFDADKHRWMGASGQPPALVDRAAGKVKSDEAELWLRLVRSPKLVDRVRSAWGFRGILVKFKLEVGMDEWRVREIAEPSRRHSAADLMVANTLEGAESWALIGPLDGTYQRLDRAELAPRLLAAVERLHRERANG
jgi:phosphopantothenoylcysteine synthetase/decarboxylase